MFFPSFHSRFASASRPVRRPQAFPRHVAQLPILERLEDRCLLAVFTVTTAADSGPGSLREAILLANTQPGADTITFAIGDGGVQTLQLTSSLPRITDPVILDGTTQLGFAGQPLIVLNGTNAGSSSVGLEIDANGCTVRGLVIQAFSSGVRVTGSGNTIAGNYVGTDDTGIEAVGNGLGVAIWGSNNLLGGSTPADRNLISGNGDGVSFLIPESGPGPRPAVASLSQNRVQGNFIGTDVSGMAALGNRNTGIALVNFLFSAADGNPIGGTDPGTGNVISGNGMDGVLILNARRNTVQGNWIGTDASGTHILANGSYGINISVGNTGASPSTVSNNQIGGAMLAARNLISGNRLGGVHVGAPNPVLGNWIGTDGSGTAALGNTIGIVVDGSGITIGGTDPGAGNLISGNLNSGILLTGSNNQVEGNTIGVDSTGTHAVPNGFGVYVMAGTNNQVGGREAGAGNVISGNLTGIVLFSTRDTTVQGNRIGTDAVGSQAIGNAIGIDVRGAATLIGGTAAGAGSVISDNTQIGVSISGSGTQVQGNTIGTDVTGTVAVANGEGIYVTAGTDQVTIGGTESGMGNLISGNRDAGVVLSGQSSVVAGNWLGTDRSGTKRLGNLVGVRVDGTSNTLGGTTAGARNVISGNLAQGVAIMRNANTVEGNYFGTDTSGTAVLGNGSSQQVFRADVLIFQAADNLIGGVTLGAG
ncbi:MAG TPA: hypothetical protein VKU02_31065, partial [Gemmataceae bacterium]|nr:hypothetical protein [Gemmataceae bacterium]